MAKVTVLYRLDKDHWFRAEPRDSGYHGCRGCYFRDLQGSCAARPCTLRKGADQRDVVFKLIPEVTAKRLRADPARKATGEVWITHPLSGRLLRPLKDTKVVNIQ